jgi:hypothetical protein
MSARTVAWFFLLFPLLVDAGQSACENSKCSASVSVRFKIVIPERVRIKVDEVGMVKGSGNSGRAPAYTRDDKGVVTVSFP